MKEVNNKIKDRVRVRVRVSTWSPWKGKNNSPRQISAMGSYNMLYGGSGESFVGETRDKLDFV